MSLVGIDVNVSRDDDMKPFTCACLYGQIESINFIWQSSPSVSLAKVIRCKKNTKPTTLFLNALEEEQIDVIKTLFLLLNKKCRRQEATKEDHSLLQSWKLILIEKGQYFVRNIKRWEQK